MSFSIIKDGTGKGYSVKVNSDNQMETYTVAEPKSSYVSNAKGSSYLLATGGFISITSGESAVFYIKYTGEKLLHIDSIRSCGNQSQKWRMYKDSTGGTITSGAAAVKGNANLTSSNSLSATVLKGADGLTVTGGSVMENWINNMGHSIEDYQGAVIMGKDDVIVLTCEVDTAADVCVRVLCYEEEKV